MKKTHAILSLLLCLSLGLSLCACGSTASAAAVEAAPAAQAAEPADNSAPEAPGEEPAYDPAAYEAAAQAVKDEFIQVILDGLDEFDEDAHPELPWYTAALTRFEENSFYEARHDFDGNGVPELLIGAGFGDYLSPIAVYAFDGRDMHYLCREVPLGERVHLSRADDLFVVRASDGAAAGSLTIDVKTPTLYGSFVIDSVLKAKGIEHETYFVEGMPHEFYDEDGYDVKVKEKVFGFLYGLTQKPAVASIRAVVLAKASRIRMGEGNMNFTLGSGKDAQYAVIDMRGRKVMLGTVHAAEMVDLSGLNAGVYILNVRGERPVRFGLAK